MLPSNFSIILFGISHNFNNSDIFPISARILLLLDCTGFPNDTSEPEPEPGMHEARLGNQEVPSVP